MLSRLLIVCGASGLAAIHLLTFLGHPEGSWLNGLLGVALSVLALSDKE